MNERAEGENESGRQQLNAISPRCWEVVAVVEQANNRQRHCKQREDSSKQGVASKTEGWLEVLPGDCESALADLPAEAQAFVYAKSDSAHAGKGLVFDGSERFCVAADLSRFTVEGRRDCRRRGYVEADLTPVADASGRRTVTFTEKDDFGRRPLAAATGVKSAST